MKVPIVFFTPQEILLVLIPVKRLSRPQGHSAARRIMAMKNSNDTIGNRIRDLPTYSAVPQPTVPTHVKLYYQRINKQIISRKHFPSTSIMKKVLFLDVISYYFIPVPSLRLALRLLSHHINNRKEPN
jgi:hypothetical protein